MNNRDKFSDLQVKHILKHSHDLLNKFDYLFSFVDENLDIRSSTFIDDFNHENKLKSMKQESSENITSMYINLIGPLLRRRSKTHPKGRLTKRFRKIKKLVTIVNKHKDNNNDYEYEDEEDRDHDGVQDEL